MLLNTTMSSSGLSILPYTCHKMDSGTMFLPMTDESAWSNTTRIILYLILLLWCFMGVAIAADLFMCAIEVITSKTKILKVATDEDVAGVGFEEVEIRVWNGTVANLTLMALGSSAPEILLSIIEIVSSGFQAGELGPGTIVGSAAFNLFCITAVCIMAIPKGEVKRINSFSVFLVTAFFAVWAYIWLFIILVVSTPSRIDIWEAVLTLLFFPILVILAYIADKDLCSNVIASRRRKHEIELGNLDLLNEKVLKQHHPDLIDYMREITSNPNITEEEAAKLIAIKIEANKRHDYGYYRVNALRNFGGSRKPVPKVNDKLNAMLSASQQSLATIKSDQDIKAHIEFTATAVSVMENCRTVQLGVDRKGNVECEARVNFETIDGTAEDGSDYIAKKDTLVFAPKETHKYIEIEIIDDNEWEPDETFFVKLHPSTGENVVLGQHSITEVTIINDDEPGTFNFEKPSHIFKESCGKAEVTVTRTNGADGQVEIKWKTKNQTAVHGKDFIGGEGVLVFDNGETEKAIDIEIVDDHMFEKDETFMIELVEIEPQGAKFGRLKRTVVTVVSDDEYKRMFDRVVNMAHLNLDKFRLGSDTWGQQFKEAMNVNGGDIDNASVLDYIMHFITFVWKVIFAFVPPCTWYGGWLAFFVILALIGVMTALISDVATIFGCLIGLKKEVTAITFVALGTSLPDLFASKNAACHEKYADASIVNVTGSNGVNVFLGLGIPWIIAAIYHAVNKTPGGFAYPAGSLGTSVITYTVIAITCIVILIVRRSVNIFGGGELGGHHILKFVTGGFMCFTWLLYVLISSLVAYEHIEPLKF